MIDDGIKENATYSDRNVHFITKKGNPVICGNVGEPGGYYSNCNKPNIRQMLSLNMGV